MDYYSPVTALAGVGREAERKLSKLGIKTIEDLLHHYPRRYDDYSRVVTIERAAPGMVTIRGKITRVHTRRTQKGKDLTEALIEDETGSLQAVWFNQPYLARSLPKNKPVYIAGELAFAYNKYALQSPAVELVSRIPRNAARIIPIYPETEGITSKQLRKWMSDALEVSVPDSLPEDVRLQYNLSGKATALANIHFPPSQEAAETARYRLAFEELFVQLWRTRQQRAHVRARSAPQVEFDEVALRELVSSLPFELTEGQRKTAWRIIQDVQRPYPMNRLLQGDVGSGKTVVAALAAAAVTRSGGQTVLLAPTEVLAAQHQRTLEALLRPLDIQIGLLTGSVSDSQKQALKQRLASGEQAVCVGTHALLEESVEFQQLALTIVDEQHRFGVEQRSRLRQSDDVHPHYLSMTATPIPRSLALTVYGDLDISTLDELPSGRQPIRTRVSSNRRQLLDHLREIIAGGEQVYVVCPLVSESDTLGTTSVEQEVKRLRDQLPKARVTGLHGQLPARDKHELMQRFHAGEVDVLVATTVVEVGVDVANATVIVIEGAERFGLATLHQLRGRVGRGGQKAYCYLVPSTPQHVSKRLKLLEHHRDGRLLAEQDLQLRGAGELHGERQHGSLDLRLAHLGDVELIRTVKQAVADIESISDNSVLWRRAARRHGD